MTDPYVIAHTIPMYEYRPDTWQSRRKAYRRDEKNIDKLLGKDYTRLVVGIIVAVVVLLGVFACSIYTGAHAENEILYVCVSEDSWLNGRAEPHKDSFVTLKLYSGDTVEVVGTSGEWVEVIGGETGTSFVSSKYLSQTLEPFTVTNVSGGRVKVRSYIDGKVVGYVKAGKSVKVTRTMLGWGYIGNGWVKLEFFK